MARGSLIARHVDMRQISGWSLVLHARTSPSRRQPDLRTRPPNILLRAVTGSAPLLIEHTLTSFYGGRDLICFDIGRCWTVHGRLDDSLLRTTYAGQACCRSTDFSERTTTTQPNLGFTIPATTIPALNNIPCPPSSGVSRCVIPHWFGPIPPPDTPWMSIVTSAFRIFMVYVRIYGDLRTHHSPLVRHGPPVLFHSISPRTQRSFGQRRRHFVTLVS
jgi:hypothetical protein